MTDFPNKAVCCSRGTGSALSGTRLHYLASSASRLIALGAIVATLSGRAIGGAAELPLCP